MTKFRRNTANKKQQRATLVRIFLVLASILLFTILLFQIDSFPADNNNTNTRQGGGAAPLLSPDKILTGQVSKQLKQQQQQIRRKAQREFNKERVDDYNTDDAASGSASADNNADDTTQEDNDDGGSEKEGGNAGAAAAYAKNNHNSVKGKRYVMELANLVNNEEEDDGGGGAATGKVIIETRPSWAPIGVSHFDDLVQKHHFYDGCRFFRVVTNFIVQFGISPIPAMQRQLSAQLKDDPVAASNVRGTITYATSGPNTRTTQLFINTKKDGSNAFLDQQGFSPFAVVVEGMEYVDMINSEYGEKPGQGKIRNRGNDYLEAEFPNLSYIVSIREIDGPATNEEEEEEEAAAAAVLAQ